MAGEPSSTATREPAIEQRQFLDLVRRLDLDQLRRMPAARWPARLSAEAMDQLPADKRRLVERRYELLQGAPAAARPRSSPARRREQLMRSLGGWLEQIEAHLLAAEQDLRAARALSIEQGGAGTGRSEAALSELARDELRCLYAACSDRAGSLTLLLSGHRAEMGEYLRLLRGVGQPPAAVRELRLRLGKLWSRYRFLRLNLACHEMERAREQIAAADAARAVQAQAVARVDAELRKASGWKARLSGQGSAEHRRALREMRDRLLEAYETSAARVPREDVHDWLNTLVDAYLDAYCTAVGRSQIDRGCELFADLVSYRRRLAQRLAERRERRGDRTQPLSDDRSLILGCIERRVPGNEHPGDGPSLSERLHELRDRLLAACAAGDAGPAAA